MPSPAPAAARSAQISAKPVTYPSPATVEPKPEDPPADGKDAKAKAKKGQLRGAGGETWRDPTLDEWPDNDYRIFVGDLGNEVNDELLAKAFSRYATF